MKKIIRKKLDFNIHELEGYLEDAIQVLQSYLILDGEVEVSIEEVDYDTTTIVLYGTREETDQEEAKRIELSLLTSELSEEFSKILEIDIDDMQKKIYEF